MLNRHFPWVPAVVTIAAMSPRRTPDLTIRARDGRIRATAHWPTIARAIVFGLGLVGLLSPATQAAGGTLGTSGMPPTLVQAQKIRAQVNARYLAPGGPGLAVTEASSTGVIESFSLVAPEGATSRPCRRRHLLRHLPPTRPLSPPCARISPARRSLSSSSPGTRARASRLPRDHGQRSRCFAANYPFCALHRPARRARAGSGHADAHEETRGQSHDRS